VPTLRSLKTRFTFWGKLAAAVALVALAEVLFTPEDPPGAVAGAFALGLGRRSRRAQSAVRRDPRARLAATLAAALALLLVEAPGALAFALFLTALGMAALLPRSGRFDDAWRWSGRLAFNAATAFLRPLRDAARLRRQAPPSARGRLRTLALALILPITGGAVFLALFAAANPVISGALEDLRSPRFDLDRLLRLVFWILVLIAVWSVLRPRLPRRAPPAPSNAAEDGHTQPERHLDHAVADRLQRRLRPAERAGRGVPVGARGLPEGMTLAEYAHRGAYPLIATALLAGCSCWWS
jgi:MFS family permease